MSTPARKDELDEQIALQVEVQAKYAGYIDRQAREIAKHAKRILVLRDGEIIIDTEDVSQAIQALQSSPDDENDDFTGHNDRASQPQLSE